MVIGMDEFANGNPAQIYARLRPDQRTAIAGEFARRLRMAGDPQVAQFEQEWNRDDGPVPHTLSVAQAAAIHSYTREHHPELVEQVAQHPVTLSALANAGVPATEEAPEEVPATVPHVSAAPDALVDSMTGEVINIAQQGPAPAPTPQSEPMPISSNELAEHELRAHDPTNEAIAREDPGAEL